jgi:hypothetical protein
MPPAINLLHQRFGRIVITEFAGHNEHGRRMWTGMCDCGTPVTAIVGSWRYGNTTSCGCAQTKHGHSAIKQRGSDTPEYRAYHRILSATTNPRIREYKTIGALGIEVKFRDFVHFLNTVGLRPSEDYFLSRKDASDHYSPSNCEWVQRKPRRKRAKLHKNQAA